MTGWLATMPGIAFAGATGALALRRGRGLREAVLEATVLGALWLVLGTEVLGLAGALRPGAIRAWWAVPAVAGIAYLVHRRHELRRALAVPRVPTVWCALVALSVVALATLALLSALLAPPNNYDSLSYHLPRIAFWLQQGSVEHYSTNNLRQLMMPPLAEYAGAHLMALDGHSDRLLGLTQWLALVVTMVVTSMIAERLGGGAIVQWLACLFVVSCPIAFMQASSTKNDLVAGMWLAISAWLALRWWEETPTLRSAALLGAALGACALTKGTGVLFVVPVAGVAVIGAARRAGRRALAALGVVAAVAFLLNAPFIVRNVRQFGRPLGPAGTRDGGYDLVNERWDLRTLASNASRSLAQQAALPSDAYNAALQRGVIALHERVLGVPVNDPATTTPHSSFGEIRYWPTHEDLAPAPAHVLLVLLLPLGLLLRRPGPEVRVRVLLVGGIGAGAFALICLVLKWQEWNVRFLASLVGVLAPAVAVAAAARFGTPAAVGGAAVLCLAVVPSVKSNPRPLFSEVSVFKRDAIAARFHYVGGAEDVVAAADLALARRAVVVGLATIDNDPDYLYVQVISERLPWKPVFEYVNPSVAVPGTRHLGADLVIAPAKTTELVDRATGTRYRLQRAYERFALLVPVRDAPGPSTE